MGERRSVRVLDGCPYVEMAGTDHVVSVRRPEELNHVVLAFLGGIR